MPEDRPADHSRTPDAEPPSPVASLRGVVTFDTNEILVLVRGPIDQVAAAFAAHTKAAVWEQDAAGKTVTVRFPCYLVYQLVGHPYTTITLYAGADAAPGAYPDGGLARALSAALNTKAILYGNSDTASATSLEVYEHGNQLERFECFEGVAYASTLRDPAEAPPDGPGIYPFVDRLMREHDAFAPGWSTALGGWQLKNGQQVTLDLAAEDLDDDLDDEDGPLFVRMDYVAV